MSSQTIGVLGIVAFLILLLGGIPVGAAMAIVGFFGYWAISGMSPALNIAGMIPYSSIAFYGLTVVPLFILMGHFAYYAGFPTDAFNAARKWVGGLKGGLVQATILGSALFGAACGSGMAECAIISKITIPEMVKQGVDRKMAYGVVAAAANLASLIPPSVIMVIYGVITGTSIGKLLIAGIVPGILQALCFMIFVYIRAIRNPSLTPPVQKFSWKERFVSIRGVWGIMLVVVIFMGGIYTGIFTPTEAGAVGAFGVLIASLFLKKMNWNNFKDCLLETAKTTGSLMLIIAGAFIFGNFFGISRIPANLTQFLITLEVPSIVIIIGIMILYIILGTFMDIVAALFLTLPIVFPAVKEFGYDPVWFGILVVIIVEIALVSPPYGLNLFILKGVIENATMGEVISGVLPFMCVMIATLGLYIAFPQIALWLPNLMK